MFFTNMLFGRFVRSKTGFSVCGGEYVSGLDFLPEFSVAETHREVDIVELLCDLSH